MAENSESVTQRNLEISRLCYQCGQCTGTCPMRRVSRFNPRSFLHDFDADTDENEQWNCLICDNCYAVCPQGVDFPSIILSLRREEDGAKEDILAHRIFSDIASFMTFFDKGVPTEFEGEIDENSEYGYFPGCLDYLDLFMDVGVNFHEIGDYAVKLLNEIGIKPRIASLKCCGHDMLYQGNYKVFEQLTSYNTKKIKEMGIKKLVVSCAECFFTFKNYYELEASGIEIIHISQLLSDKLEFIDIEEADNRAIPVTYHDPCAMKRFQVYEAPRDAIKNAGVRYVELGHSRDNSLCCGVSGMMNCTDMSKALRAFRLEEVKEKGVDVLITTCPKCLSHLNCLKKETENEEEGKREYKFEIVDLAVFLGRLLEGKE